MPALYTTKRDLEVLKDLASYRFLSVPQIARLHFPSERAAQDRLRRLRTGRLIVRVSPPVRSSYALKATVYALTRAGAELLALRSGEDAPRAFSSREQRSALFLDHTLRRNDIRVALELLARESRVQLGLWRQSPKKVTLRAVVPGRPKREVSVVPDGFFVTIVGGRCTAYFLEVDMGTVRLKRMRERYAAYWHLWKSGGHRDLAGDAALRVVTVAATARRAENLRKLAMNAPPGRRGSKLFLFSSFDKLDLTSPADLIDARFAAATVREPELEPLIDVAA